MNVVIDIASQFGWCIICHPIVVGTGSFRNTEEGHLPSPGIRKKLSEERELDIIEKVLSKENSMYKSMKAFAVLGALGWGRILNLE